MHSTWDATRCAPWEKKGHSIRAGVGKQPLPTNMLESFRKDVCLPWCIVRAKGEPLYLEVHPEYLELEMMERCRDPCLLPSIPISSHPPLLKQQLRHPPTPLPQPYSVLLQASPTAGLPSPDMTGTKACGSLGWLGEDGRVHLVLVLSARRCIPSPHTSKTASSFIPSCAQLGSGGGHDRWASRGGRDEAVRSSPHPIPQTRQICPL